MPKEKTHELLVVPWYNAAQFQKVYEHLFSPKIDKKRWALDQIAVWETRCHPSLPLAIEATFVLTSAVVQDILFKSSATVSQQIDIQCLYSTAIVRFVNLTVDIMSKNQYKPNMASLAKELGIPSYIIDVRNEACHSFLPPLAILRMSAQAALKYLKKTYWDVEATKVQNYVQSVPNEAPIRKLLKEFQDIQLMELYNTEMSHRKRKSYSPDLSYILERIENCIAEDIRLFIKVLASLDGPFILSDNDLKFVTTEEEYILFQEERDDDPEHLLQADQKPYSVIPPIPQYHVELWYHIIALLNRHDAVPLFLEELLKTVEDRTAVGQKLVISWATSILSTTTTVPGLRFRCNDTIKRIFKNKGITVNWHSMFHAALVKPCKYNAFLLSQILSNVTLGEKRVQRIMSLFAIYKGQIRDGPDGIEENSIYTVEDLKRMKIHQKSKKLRIQGKSNDCLWSQPSDESYKTWPIGKIVNPVEAVKEEDSEEIFDVSDPNEGLETKYILESNENVTEEYPPMEVEDKYNFEKDFIEELNKRPSLLYNR